MNSFLSVLSICHRFVIVHKCTMCMYVYGVYICMYDVCMCVYTIYVVLKAGNTEQMISDNVARSNLL